ncbi:MAG: S8 family serine peptidase [Bacteroidales bacterium]
MKTKIFMMALATLLTGSVFFVACQKDLDIKESEDAFEKDATAALEEEIAEGYLIGFHNTPDPALILRAGGSIIRSYNNFPVLHVNLPEQALAGLSRAPGISFIERNQVRSISGTFSQNCPEDNLVCAEGQIKTFHMSRIGVQAAWRSGVTGQGLRMAVLDTGIDGNHKDLKDNLASDGFTVIKTGSPTSRHWLVDPKGHGTHVAGTAGASGNLNESPNALLGVAPDVTLVSVRVLNADGYGSVADIAAGIDWCINNNIDIINMSLGGSYSHAEYVVVETAWNAGLLTIACAGNSGNDEGTGENVWYPAAYDEVIAVAATNQQVDGRRLTSSTGPSVELIAPGTQVFSTYINESGYDYMSGTSMATPHVSGVAALIWSSNSSLTNQQVRDLLRNNTECLGLPTDHQGHGLVRADKAMGIETGRVMGLVYADNQPVYAANLTFSNGSSTFKTTSSGQIGYTIIVPPGTYTATASFNYGYEPVSNVVTVNADDIIGTDFSFTGEGPDPDPVYTITGIVTDAEDNSALPGATVSIDETNYSVITGSDGSFEILNVNQNDYFITASLAGYISEKKSISVFDNTSVDFALAKDAIEPPPNDPPVANYTYTTSGLMVNFTDTSTDSDGTIVGWAWEFEVGSTSGDQNPAHTYAAPGTYPVTLTVTDNGGEMATASQDVTVTDGNAGEPELSIDLFALANTSNPQFARVMVNWEVSGQDLSEVTLSITGPNNDSRTWSVSGSSASGQHEFSFRRGHGDYTVTLTVTDASGNLTETREITL